MVSTVTYNLKVIMQVEVFILLLSLRALPSLINLADNRITDSFNLLQFLFILLLVSRRVVIQPLQCFGHSLINSCLVFLLQFISQLVTVANGVFHVVAVSFELVACIHLFLEELILFRILLSLLHHSLNLFLGKSTLVIGDGNFLLLPCALIFSCHIQNAIGINLEGNLNLGNSSGCWGDVCQFEFTQQVVVFSHGTFTLEHLDLNCCLLVLVCGKCLGLLIGDDSVSWDKLGHNSSNCLNALCKWSDIQQQDVLGFLTTLS
mmetsp:Transcript_28486/g.54349  ORF Transcript_28486/g.54349 Transcript_28486/m.54349 type:complete len:262 (+) Transcript_28486:450-1235(+)